MFNRGQRFAFLLVLAARPAHYHVQGFHALQPIVSAGRCVSCRGTAASSAGGVVRPHAAAVASGCACATCVAPVSVWREVLGGRARRTRSTMVAMGEEGGEVAAAAVPEIDLTDKTVEVSSESNISCFKCLPRNGATTQRHRVGCDCCGGVHESWCYSGIWLACNSQYAGMGDKVQHATKPRSLVWWKMRSRGSCKNSCWRLPRTHSLLVFW